MPQPGGREPAPDGLRLIQEFVNTNDIENGRELFAEPAALRDWLIERSLLARGARVTRRDHQQAIEVREALRTLMEENNGRPAAPAAADLLTRAAARSGVSLRFAGGSGQASELRPASVGVAGALGQLLIAVHCAMSDGTWSRMKACTDDRCRWAFYDHSRNASGRWCSMAVCGTRAKIEGAAERAGRSRRSR